MFRVKTGGYLPFLSKLGYGIKTLSDEANVLFPLLGEWHGDSRSPGMLLITRRGQLMTWSPFGPDLLAGRRPPQSNENFNLCISGVPGSGKSVFMQELLLSTLGVGGKVFVLDYGRSFKRTCQMLQGQYIEFDIKTPLSLNPFSSIPEGRGEEAASREDALQAVYSILGCMAAPRQGTTDHQNALLQRALREAWSKKKSAASISDVAERLLHSGREQAQELGEMLYPFTRNGLYGAFFTGPCSVNLDSDLVVIETDHLRSCPELLNVIVRMVILHINQTMVHSDRSQPFLILIDEAWKLLGGKESGSFIASSTRVARKYKGSITLATQQLTDYFRPEAPAATEAFDNSTFHAILKQNPDAFQQMTQHPKLTHFVREEWELRRLQSVHSSPPHYSEFALYGNGIHGVILRLILDPFTLLLTSSNADDYKELEKRVQKGMSPEKAVEDLLRERGVSA